MFAGDGDDSYAFPNELGPVSPTSKDGLGATTPVADAGIAAQVESAQEDTKEDLRDEAKETSDPPPRSANTKFRMRKLDHESLIRKEIEERKAMVRQMNSVRAEPHPLETQLRKEITRRPKTVNTEIFEGLGIGEKELENPAMGREEKLKSQKAFQAELDRDAKKAGNLREAMKDEAYYYKDRKPVSRPQPTGMDIDPSAPIVSFGAAEERMAAEKRAAANEWMKKSLAEADAVRDRKKAQRKQELAPPETGEFAIGKATDGSAQAKRLSQQLYRAQLNQDLASMQRAPSAKGLDISFTFGGKSRDDRPTTSEQRSKVNAQAEYREALDTQRRQAQERADEARRLHNAAERNPPPYLE